MSWFSSFITSSIGRKIIMSLTGLFLMLFLVIHLIGNLQLLIDDGGEAFNVYAKMMTTNPLIKAVSYFNYLFILLHAVQGIMLWMQNRSARQSRYAVSNSTSSSYSSRNMGWLGTVILVFIIVHMGQFWFKMKFGDLPMETYPSYAGEVKNLYLPVAEAFSAWYFVLFYVVCMVIIGFHLYHGFQSAFQSLGLNHKKYTPAIKTIGTAYAILIPLGFALIPILFFFTK